MYFLRKSYSALLFILTLSFSYGQINLDSLSKELDNLAVDTSSINYQIRTGLQYTKINLDASVRCFKSALENSKKINNKYFIAKSAVCLGANYNLLGDFGSAAESLILSLKLAEELNDKELITKCLLTIGNMYSYSQQTKLAKGMYLKALKMSEAAGNELERATILNNLGALTYRESNLNEDQLHQAVSYFLRALQIVEKTGNKEELITKYNNLGLVYCDMGKNDSALHFLKKSKQLIDLNSNYDDLITYHSYMGRIYVSMKEFNLAEINYQASLNEAKELNNKEWVYEAYLSLAGMYEAMGNFEKAFTFYRQYSLLKDSAMNESNFAIASDIKNKFEREKKEVELNQLKTEQSKQKIFNIALILVSILTVISGIMMYSRFKIKSVSESKLKIQNDIITQKNKDITDSINYARKIQQSALPQEKYIERELKKLKG